jgi:hypothetical protein
MKKNAAILTLLCIFLMHYKNTFAQSDNLVYIDTEVWKPENINIDGDNNVIFYGDNIVLNRVEIPENALKKIENQYRNKLKNIRAKVGKQKDKISEINQEILQLQIDTRTAIISAHELQQNFLNIDFERSSQKFQTAYEAFKNGLFEEAQILLDAIHLEAEDKKNADNRKLKANLHAIKFEFKQASTNFEVAIRIYEDFDNLFDYGYYLMAQSNVIKAEEILNHSLKYSKSDIQQAVVLTNIGILARKQNQSPKAIDYYLKSIPFYQKVAKNEPIYIAQLATILNNVGSLTLDMGLLDDAKVALDSALKVRKILFGLDAKAYGGELATTLMNLGLLHQKKSNIDTAFIFFNEAVVINRARLNDESWKAKSDMAKNLDYLGGLYWDSSNFESAEAAYLESILLFNELSNVNPENFEIEKSKVLSNLGYFYIDFDQPDKGIKQLDLARISLSENKFSIYSITQPLLGTVLHNIGLGYERKQSADEALQFYNQALKVREVLINPADIETQANFAQTMNCIANILTDKEQWDTALKAYLVALEKRALAFKFSKYVYGLDYTETMINLSLYFHTRFLNTNDQKDKESALEYNNNALLILKILPDSSRRTQHINLANSIKATLDK